MVKTHKASCEYKGCEARSHRLHEALLWQNLWRSCFSTNIFYTHASLSSGCRAHATWSGHGTKKQLNIKLK